ncbi:MAG: DUF192 domain-containing protein [Chloroflexota bacterium]
MERSVAVRNRSRDGEVLLRARWCQSFLCRLRGLTFRRSLPQEEGLLLVEPRASRAGTAIHMWGVLMDLGVLWLDPAGRVVDRRLARPWRIYLPKAPAQFVLEGPPSLLEHAGEGEKLEFVDATLA